MKSGIIILKVADSLIKKIFFKWRKNNVSQQPEEVMCIPSETDEKEMIEYVKSYQSATRWQTI